jgi:hypothetical protein
MESAGQDGALAPEKERGGAAGGPAGRITWWRSLTQPD